MIPVKCYGYDFEWIEKEVRQWSRDIRRKLSVDMLCTMLPDGITYYYDLDKSVVCTHLRESINDLSEYRRQRNDYIKKVVGKYKLN